VANLQTTVTASTEVIIEPALKTKLEKRLTIYAKLDAEYELAKAKRDKEKANIDGYFEQADAKSITLEGIATLTRVEGVSSKLDKKLFVKQGGTLAQLENATVTTPKKAYTLITLAKVSLWT
jgi:hypothetical protein